jgi:hypothetical protein
MVKQPSLRVQDCRQRADDCARRAETAGTDESRQYWETQEVRWIQIAAHSEFSEQIGSFLKSGRPDLKALSEFDNSGLDALVEVFNRVCTAMDIDPQDESQSRIVTQILVRALMGGESDLVVLYQLVLQAISY